MTEDKGLINAELDFFYTIKGFEAHTKLIVPGTPTVETYETAIERIQKAGGIPRDGLPGKAAEAPTDTEFTCEECGGPMTYRKGTSKAGKPYKGWFCSKRDCKGKPVWDDE